MKITRKHITKLTFGISAVAGVMFMQGCSSTGEKQTPPDTVPPIPVAEKIEPAPALVEHQPLMVLTTSYTVAKGDTLTAIAARHGLRWQDVAAVNPGLDANKLRIGQVIQLPGDAVAAHAQVKKPVATTTPAVPAAAGKVVSYKVKKGDSLSAIAYRFGVTVASLKNHNNLTSDVIVTGKTLKIVNPTKSGAALAKTQPPKQVTAPVAVKPVIATPAPIKTPLVPEKVVTPPVAPPKQVESAEVSVPAVPVPEIEAVKVDVPVAPNSEKPVATEQPYIEHKIAEGEDLFAISIRWGVMPRVIEAFNNLSGNDMKPGMIIKVPQPAAQ